MEKFLETQSNPRPSQEETESLNQLISTNEIESIIKKLPAKKYQTRWLDRRILPNIQRKINSWPLKLFQNIEQEGRTLNQFYEASIILLSKSDKDTTKKENQRPISLMNVYARILTKILANGIQQHLRRSCAVTKWDVSLGYRLGQYLQNN